MQRSGSCVCRKPHPCWWSERIGDPVGMIALILFVLGILASPFKAKSRLEAENAALRQQLIVLRRKVKSWPRLANTDRWFFVQLYRWFPSILDVLTIIRPETLVRWHRAGFRRYWHWKSRRRGGRPQVQSELRALIRQMSVENPLWGAPRIHGELLKLGFEVSQSSVAKYMVKRRGPPSQGGLRRPRRPDRSGPGLASSGRCHHGGDPDYTNRRSCGRRSSHPRCSRTVEETGVDISAMPTSQRPFARTNRIMVES